jgi:hypothetical protein
MTEPTIRRITVQTSPGKMQDYLKITKAKKGCRQVVKCLPSMRKAMSSNPSTKKEKKDYQMN